MPTQQRQQQLSQQTDGHYLVRRAWQPLKKSLIVSLVTAFLLLVALTENSFAGGIFMVFIAVGPSIMLTVIIIWLAAVALFRATKQYSGVEGIYKKRIIFILISGILVELGALYLFFWLGWHMQVGDQNFYLEFFQWLPTLVRKSLGGNLGTIIGAQ